MPTQTQEDGKPNVGIRGRCGRLPLGLSLVGYDALSCVLDEVRVSEEFNPWEHRSQDLFNQRQVVAEDPKFASARSKLGDCRRHFRIGFRVRSSRVPSNLASLLRASSTNFPYFL